MEAGCVMRSVADILFTHLREQKIQIFLYILQSEVF